jgi:hypothetical protein
MVLIINDFVLSSFSALSFSLFMRVCPPGDVHLMKNVRAFDVNKAVFYAINRFVLL